MIPADDPQVLLNQYYGQVVLDTTLSYGIIPSAEVYNLYIELEGVNATWPYELGDGQMAKVNETRDETSSLVLQMVTDPLNEAVSGILWLMPAAVSEALDIVR